MKILLVQDKHIIGGTGGAEKICCFLANIFVKEGHDVEIATMEDVEGSTVYPLDSRVKLTNLFDPKIPQLSLKPVTKYKGKNPIKWFCSKYLREKAKIYNRKICKRLGGKEGVFKYNLRNRTSVWSKYVNEFSPDIVIVMYLESLLEITFEKKYNIPIIASINGRPDHIHTDILWHTPKYILESIQGSYEHLSGCQILLESYKNFLPNSFNGEVFVIPNPVSQIDIENIIVHTNDKDRLVITNVARLEDICKQQSIIIEIFSRLAKKYPNWDLHLWGTGNDEPILRKKIIGLGLEDRIFLKGFTDNPIEKLKKSDIFLFPSKFEGLPLALIEAMSVGLPSVGFSYCSGVNEVIKHNENGFLAKDNTEMQEYLERLMEDHELRSKFGKQANIDMRKYSPELIASKWHEMINNF